VADLYRHVDPDRVLLLRYRDLVEEPDQTLDRVCAFLGVATGVVSAVPTDNSRPFVTPGPRTRALGPVIRAGARAGALLPPQVWRKLSKPLVAQLHGSGHPARPKLTAEQRSALLEPFLPDIDLLEQVTGEDFGTWRGHRDGATFQDRRAVRA
jgi:hypothetical protein